MNNEIIIQEGTKILGINNIVLSELDGTLYVNNAVKVESSVKGALAFYTEDGLSLAGTGLDMTWDKKEELLEVTKIKTSSVESDHLTVADYITSCKISIGKWLGFESLSEKEEQPYKIKLMTKNGEEMLCFVTNEYINEAKSKVSLALSKDKFRINTGLNIQQRTIQHSVGSTEDSAGDVAVDENYFYYCIGEFDGTTKIWRRTQLTEW